MLRKLLIWFAGLAALSFFFITPAAAQTPDVLPLEFQFSVAPNPAPPGSVVTYTLLLTNTGSDPLEQIVVRNRLPSPLTVLDTLSRRPGWAGGQAQVDNPRELAWLSLTPLDPGQAQQLQIIAQLPPDFQGEIVNADYELFSDPAGPRLTGPPLRLEVAAAPTPTPSPAPVSSPTVAVASPSASTASPAPTPPDDPTPVPTSSSPPASSTSPPSATPSLAWLVGLAVIAAAGFGLWWLWQGSRPDKT